jgi:hypothetical protein
MMSRAAILTLTLSLSLSACSSGGRHQPTGAQQDADGDTGGAAPQGEGGASGSGGGAGMTVPPATGGTSGGSGGAGGEAGGRVEPDAAEPEPDATTATADVAAEDTAGPGKSDGAASGTVDWTSCGDPKAESKAGVTSAEFCAEFALVCGFGKGAGYYADLKACLAAYEGRDVHMYSDGKRVCVAYTVCAIANKLLKTDLCAVPEIYRCGHRTETKP